jgi:hypothetical protein
MNIASTPVFVPHIGGACFADTAETAAHSVRSNATPVITSVNATYSKLEVLLEQAKCSL